MRYKISVKIKNRLLKNLCENVIHIYNIIKFEFRFLEILNLLEPQYQFTRNKLIYVCKEYKTEREAQRSHCVPYSLNLNQSKSTDYQ